MVVVDNKKAILRRQRKWATATGLSVDTAGYLDCIAKNLRVPLLPATQAEFENSGGAEWLCRANAPPKMQALHSSAILAVNMFEHWRQVDAVPLMQALGIDAALKALSFERQFPTGLVGTPPTADIALELATGDIVSIECKFTEWLAPKRGNKPAFKDKYFDSGAERWAAVGLPRCQELATALMRREERFRFLHASQLLKHALGLATQYPGRSSMQYIFYDFDCRISKEHREELERFAARVGDEIAFEAKTYQDLYRTWLAREDVDAEYLQYLGRRYFKTSSPRA